MPLVLAQDAYQGIGQYLENALENDNPTMFEQCMDYLEYFLYAYYPKEIYDDKYNVVAASIHYYVATLQSYDIDMSDLEVTYYCDESQIQGVVLLLKQIEV